MNRVPRLAVFAAALFAWMAASRPVLGQGVSEPVAVTATILSPPIAGQAIQELRFGTLAVGALADVPPGPAGMGAGASSAGWRFSQVRKKETVVWQLTLPAALAKGTDALPVQWNNAGYGTLCVSQPGGACLLTRSFDPGAEPTGSVNLPNNLPGNNFDVTFYVGGRATVPAVPPGVYTAQLTLTLAYMN